jgi:cell division GTPase FtsZ
MHQRVRGHEKETVSGMMKLSLPGVEPDLQPHIVVFGVGGAGGNAVNNMIQPGSRITAGSDSVVR